jgi:phosphatidylglycerol---prolipoprotein diacylglyceryl transferase
MVLQSFKDCFLIMFPVLLSLGPVQIQTMSALLALGFLVASFIFWRKGKEDYYSEEQLFDGFLFSVAMGFVGARVGYVVFHLETLGWNIINWLNIVGMPGMSGVVGLLVASFVLYRFAQDKKWDAFEVMDFWTIAVSLGLVFSSLGALASGVDFGYPTTMPWGVVFTGLVEKHHPTQLYGAIYFLGLFLYLTWLESRYRTFRWYRATKKTAETGFIMCMGLIGTSLFSLLVGFLKPPTLEFFDVNMDRVGALVFLIAGVLLLYTRSGRSLGWKKKKKRLFS